MNDEKFEQGCFFVGNPKNTDDYLTRRLQFLENEKLKVDVLSRQNLILKYNLHPHLIFNKEESLAKKTPIFTISVTSEIVSPSFDRRVDNSFEEMIWCLGLDLEYEKDMREFSNLMYEKEKKENAK